MGLPLGAELSVLGHQLAPLGPSESMRRPTTHEIEMLWCCSLLLCQLCLLSIAVRCLLPLLRYHVRYADLE